VGKKKKRNAESYPKAGWKEEKEITLHSLKKTKGVQELSFKREISGIRKKGKRRLLSEELRGARAITWLTVGKDRFQCLSNGQRGRLKK